MTLKTTLGRGTRQAGSAQLCTLHQIDLSFQKVFQLVRAPVIVLPMLTLYGPNSFFRRFSGHNLR